MYTSTTYKGTINRVYGIYCGFKPKNLTVEEEVTVYHADEGKTFYKNGEDAGETVVLQDGETIEDYTETDKPEEENILDKE